MPDRRRGEVAVTLGGERCVLCLTLGALAELEEALGVADLPAVAERFAAGRPSSRDILAVLAARLRGGGRSLSDEAVAALPLADSVEPVVRAVADLLVATFGSDGKTLRSRRTRERARHLPVGGGDGGRSRRPAVELPRFLVRDPARACRRPVDLPAARARAAQRRWPRPSPAGLPRQARRWSITAADEFDRDGERRERQLETLDRLSQRFGTSLSDAFSRNVAEGRRLDGVLQSIGLTILTTALRSALQPSRDALRSGFAGLFGGEGAVTPFARGGIVSRGPAAPFASGGVVSAPTYFPLGRSLGLMGERGAEAAMPLARGPDGRLGVRTAAGGRPVAVTVSIQASDVESFRCSESEVAATVARAVARGHRAL